MKLPRLARRRRLFDARRPRTARRSEERPGRRNPTPRVGSDFARPGIRAPGSRAPVLLLLGGGLLAALLIAALRTEILRTRYRLGQVAEEEGQLSRRRDQLLLQVRQLRDPERLTQLANQRGFGPPERVIDLGEDVAAPGSGEPR